MNDTARIAELARAYVSANECLARGGVVDAAEAHLAYARLREACIEAERREMEDAQNAEG